MADNIYIVGFMGTGKTAVGRLLAGQLKRDFFDLDDLIVEREKKQIPDIFKEKGEPYFRGVESAVLLEISLKENQVVSCGGGAVIDPQNIEIMKRSGTIVCLTATAEVILERTGKSSHRPLLNVPDPRSQIENLLARRRECYSRADITIDTSAISVKEAAARIKAALL